MPSEWFKRVEDNPPKMRFCEGCCYPTKTVLIFAADFRSASEDKTGNYVLQLCEKCRAEPETQLQMLVKFLSGVNK